MTRDFTEAIRSRMNDTSIDISDRVAFDTQAENALGTSLVNTSVLTERGFEEIGTETDASRAVFRRDNVVVKYDHVGMDPWRNENERINWNERLPRDALHLFAPVLETGEDDVWLAMRYAPTDDVSDKQHRELLRALIIDHNLDMTDPHPDNVGLLDGRAVLIDYNFRPKPAGETDAEREEFYRSKLRDYGIEP